MSILEQTRNLTIGKIITEAVTTPYDVNAALKMVIGLAVINLNTTNSVSFTITLDTDEAFPVTVPAGSSWIGEFEDFIKTLAWTGTSPDFQMELHRRKAQ